MADTKPTKRYDCPRCGTKKALVARYRAGSGKWRYVCATIDKGDREYCYSTVNPEDAVPRDQKGDAQKKHAKTPQFRRALTGVKRFIITAAQNATPVHEGFLASLKQYCKFNDAELIVIPLRYKNATSRWTESQQNAEHWDAELVPYLYNQRKLLNENLMLMADFKTQPTASDPLSSLEAISQDKSAIYGHTKLQLKTIATPQNRLPKILTTTGACTVPNYTDSKAGKKGEFHHVLGACVVDIQGKTFYMRQVNAVKDGSFIDLEYEYRPDDTYNADRALACIFGDTHRKFMDPAVEKATFGAEGIVECLDPEYLVFHDLHDGYAENPHHKDNPFVALAKHMSGFGDVRKEVEEDILWLKSVAGKRKARLTASNHDNFLWRWIMRHDWRIDPENAAFYLETALHMAQNTKMTNEGSSTPDPFRYWLEKSLTDVSADIKCLGMDESLMIGNIEHGMHGHMGPNGSRGSIRNLRRIGVRSWIGHLHTPGIDEGAYQVGTSTPLSLEYTGGPSSWLNTHGVTYANGKRSLINVIDGNWRL